MRGQYVAHKDYNPKKHDKAMKLDWRHYKAIEMRFNKKNYKEISAEVGVSTETIRQWVMLKTFKQEEEKFRTSIRNRVKHRLNNLTDKVLDVLEDALTSDTVTPSNIRACEIVLKYSGMEPDKNININADITNTQLTLEEKKAMLLSKLAGEVINDDSDDDIIENDIIDVDYTQIDNKEEE